MSITILRSKHTACRFQRMFQQPQQYPALTNIWSLQGYKESNVVSGSCIETMFLYMRNV